MRVLEKKKWLIWLFIFSALIVFSYFENNSLEITKIELGLSGVPKGFEGLRIVHISDLHNKSFGKDQSKLIKKIKELNPDIIAITGDIVDRRKYNEEPAVKLAEGLSKIAPTFYVIGNHEAWSGKITSLEGKLSESGVRVLRNEAFRLDKNGEHINILGIDDPSSSYLENYIGEKTAGIEIDNIKKNLSRYDFNILLSHRPEMIEVYASRGIPLVLSGHAHGGQVRLPFLGGLAAPGQGLFPKYTHGVVKRDNTALVISRGLGNSIVPQRLFNRPELVLITLNRSSQ